MKNLIKLSRELVENLLNGNTQKLGKEYFSNDINTMNNFSTIIFEKDIDVNNSMEHMYQEAIANIVSQHISKKQ